MVAIALLMSTLDGTIVATALHDLQHGLGTSVTLAGWTITAYSLGLVVALSVTGKLTGLLGARRVFLGSVALFTAASLCCGLVSNIFILVALRFVQAVGGAGFTPSATRIVVAHFGAARDRAVGLFGSIFTTGALIGPLLGGVIVTSWSWRGVFLVNVPIGLALIPLAVRFIPADPRRAAGSSAQLSPGASPGDPAGTSGPAPANASAQYPARVAADRQAPGSAGREAPRRNAANTVIPAAERRVSRLDASGVLLLGVGLLSGMVAFTLLGDTPSGWVPWAAGTFTVAAVALAWFFRHVERTPRPLIPPRLIHGKGFAAVNLVNILYGGAGSGLVALIPIYATNRYGIDALGSGTLLAAEAAGAIVLSGIGAFALRRTGYRAPLYAAAILVAVGFAGVALAPIGLPAYAWLAMAAALIGIGLGWSSPASRNAGLQLVPEAAAPLAALRSTGMQVGTMAAVSIATAIMAHSASPALAQAWIYGCYAALLLVGGLLVSHRIPDHHGAW